MRGARQSLTLEPSDLGAQGPPSRPEVPLWMAALLWLWFRGLGTEPLTCPFLFV